MTAQMDAAVEQMVASEARPRVRTPIGVIVGRLPRRDETHVLREVEELERQGQPVVLVPLLGPAEEGSDETIRWSRSLVVAPLLSPALLRAAFRTLARRPLRFLSVLLRLVVAHLLHPLALLRLLALIPKAVYLADELKKSGVTHLHAHSARLPATVAWVMHELSGLGYSFTVHGPDVFAFRPLLDRKIARAEFVRSVSNFNEAYLRGLYPHTTEGKIEIVRMGVNPGRYDGPRPAADLPRRPVILSVASLVPRKGFGFLVEACASMLREGLDFECRIVGDGPLREPLQSAIEDLGAGSSIRLLGAQRWEEVVRQITECDVFVLPGTISSDGQMDGIPLSVVEAMAAGRPVVGPAISGIPEAVSGGACGILVDSTHPARVAQAIRHLLERPELCERMGNAGRRRVREEFDLSRTGAALVRLFDERGVRSRAVAAIELESLDLEVLRGTTVALQAVHERNDSLVAEITSNGPEGSRDLVVKQHRARPGQSRPPSDRARDERDVLEMLGSTLPPRGAGVALLVPEVVGFDGSRGVVAMTRAGGTPLDLLVRRHRGSRAALDLLTAPVRSAGTWLHGLQQVTRSDDDGRHLLTAVVVMAERDLDLAAAVDHAILSRREWVIDRLRGLEVRAAERALPVVGHHGDYWPGNIFVRDGAVEVIDFEGYREGLPLEDVAWFLLHLSLQFPLPPLRARYERLAQAFLDGYLGASGTLDRETLRLLTATKVLHVLSRGAAGTRPGLRRWLVRRLLRKTLFRSLA